MPTTKPDYFEALYNIESTFESLNNTNPQKSSDNYQFSFCEMNSTKLNSSSYYKAIRGQQFPIRIRVKEYYGDENRSELIRGDILSNLSADKKNHH